jgi:spermidine/putrescine transport system substrate-binding protein
MERHGWLEPTLYDHTVWGMGMLGIAFDRQAVSGGAITTIAELFQSPLHGRVALPTDMRAALGMALLADHVDPSTVSLAAAGATAARLANSVRVGQVLRFDPAGGSHPLQHLLAGDADAAVVRASDVVGLEHDHPEIVFVVPDEGGLLLKDVAVVPANANNPSGAQAYLDYARDAVHAAERFRVVPAMWPLESSGQIEEVLAVDAPMVLADPRRNPPPDVRARLHRFRFLDEAHGEEREFAALFNSVIHAAD